MAFDREKFSWRGLRLCWGKTPVLTLIQDPTYPHLYRIQYPSGWESSPANLTRAKDAAYDHGRYLLSGRSPSEAPYSPKAGRVVGKLRGNHRGLQRCRIGTNRVQNRALQGGGFLEGIGGGLNTPSF
jgi:hypothetical protein